jgi:hypothetical protein
MNFSWGHAPLKRNRGVWLSEKDNKVDFGIDSEHGLIIATVEETDGPHIYALQRDFDGAHPEGITKRAELVGDLYGVHVRLREPDGTAVDECDMMLEVRRGPSFKVGLHSAIIWKAQHLLEFWRQGIELRSKVHEIGMEAHEKGKAIGDYFNKDVLVWEKKQEEEIAEQVKDWEARAAIFVETHLGELKKKDFLNSYPSIEDGLQRKHRFTLRPRNAPAPSTPEPTHWRLYDSINARIENYTHS